MPRKRRYILPGFPHHTIQRGNNRQVVFFDKEDRENYLSNLRRISREEEVRIGAYCLMSNHIHLLLYPATEEGLKRFMKSVSQMQTQYINRKHKRTGKLWENRYKMHIVEQGKGWVIARYIERNPLRAKLARKAEAYKYSSARAHLVGVRDKNINKDIIRGRREEYRKYFHEKAGGEEEDRIRVTCQQEKPFGDEGFVEGLEKRYDISFKIRSRGRPRRS